MEYTISDNNLHIENSYKVRKKEMYVALTAIYLESPNSNVWRRTDSSLRMEWVVHNFLHSIGLWKDRTGSVDLDYPCDKPEWIYKVLGCLVWVFVK